MELKSEFIPFLCLGQGVELLDPQVEGLDPCVEGLAQRRDETRLSEYHSPEIDNYFSKSNNL